MLTFKQIENSKPKDTAYRLADAGGLFLFIPPTGKKVWRLRYRFSGKEKTLVIGSYPEISLVEARARQGEAKRKIGAGIDPSQKKRSLKITESGGSKFGAIYQEWYEHKKQVWSAGYAEELSRMFRDDILPMIGGLEINEIEPMKILEVIRRFEERGSVSYPLL